MERERLQIVLNASKNSAQGSLLKWFSRVQYSLEARTLEHCSPSFFSLSFFPSFFCGLHPKALGYQGDEVASILDDIMDTKQKKSREAKVYSPFRRTSGSVRNGLQDNDRDTDGRRLHC